jgi:hypothetical protein
MPRRMATLFLWLVSVVAFASPVGAIINGAPEDPSKWGSTFVLKTTAGTCTATLIGRRVIVTAAQCLGTEGNASIEWNNGAYVMTCQAHPKSSADQSLDVALCALDRDIVGTPERININPDLLKPGVKLSLAGYGCRKPGGVDSAVGNFSVGDARLLGFTQPVQEAQSTFAIADGAAICLGDAGAGAYIYRDGSGERILAGVAARGDLARRSFIVPTSSRTFLAWATIWAAENGVSICGVGGECAAAESAISPAVVSVKAEQAKLNEPTTSLILPVPIPSEGARGAPTAAELVVTVKAGEAVNDTITRVCGAAQPDGYFIELEKRSGIGASTTFDFEREISIPVCSASIHPVVQTNPGDVLWKLYWDRSRRSSWKDFERPPNTPDLGDRSEYFLDVFKALNPRVKDVNNLDGATVIVPIAPLSDATVSSTTAINPAFPGPQAIFGLQSANCSSRDAQPFDVNALLDVLRANRKFAQADPKQALVFIADTGLYGVGMPRIFTDKILRAPGGFTDDFLQSIRPPEEIAESAHGTQVASTVLGGPLFARVQAIFGARINIAFLAIYHRQRLPGGIPWIGVKDEAFEKALTKAENAHADIINLSIKTSSKIEAIHNHQPPGLLFVVAAGNNDGNLANRPVYPAKFGGPSNKRLITVAALDGGKVPEWSNYGSEWVEIGAPGCDVPVLTYDKSGRWKQEALSGTSFAAPLVSFTAALIKSEAWGMNAEELKRRLLVSADLDAKWERKIADGRKLNILKALALFQDVVELANRPLLFGTLKGKYKGAPLRSQEFSVECSDKETRSLTLASILKIRPAYRTIDGKAYAKIYYRDTATDDFMSQECILPPTLEFSIVESDLGTETSLQMDQVVDIVRKYVAMDN